MIPQYTATIIRSDKFVRLNNESCNADHELTWLPKNIHAIQWYGNEGEIEYTNDYPEKIYSFNPYYQYVVNELKEYKLKLEAQNEEYKKLYFNPELMVRRHRNNLLLQSDWSQLPDNQLSKEQQEAWKIYRQKLRDLPNTISDFNLYSQDLTIWPVPPQ